MAIQGVLGKIDECEAEAGKLRQEVVELVRKGQLVYKGAVGDAPDELENKLQLRQVVQYRYGDDGMAWAEDQIEVYFAEGKYWIVISERVYEPY